MFDSLKKMVKKSAEKPMTEEERKKAEAREKRIQSIMEKTGWTHEETVKQVKKAREQFGITYADYDRYDFHSVPIEEQEEAYKQILEKKARQKAEREAAIASIMEKTGWTHEETVEKTKEARERIGIKVREYDEFDMHEVAEPLQERTYKARVAEKKEKRETVRRIKERCITDAMSAMGWTREQAEEHLAKTKERTHCKYPEYDWYRFYALSEEEQDKVCLKYITGKVSAKFNANPEFARLLDNKEKTNVYFDEFIKRPWCVNVKISAEDFAAKFANSNRIIYKPIEGIGGHGIRAYDINSENIGEVYAEVNALPEGVVEEYLVQHHRMSELSPSSVNTMRVATVVSKTKPVTADGKMADIAYAALRFGGGDSVVDNFHSGGLVAAVDLATGEVVTDAADQDCKVFTEHPVTGTKIKGFKIPYFEEALELVRKACEKELVEGSLGWDIAFTEDGPVMIEANVGPAVELMQMPYMIEGKGMRHVIEKYLNV